MNIAVRVERVKEGKLLSDRVCFILLLSCSYSLLVCLVSLTSLWVCVKRKGHPSWRKKIPANKHYAIFFTYIPLFLLHQAGRGLCFPLTQVTAFYSKSHFTLMDILSADSFWFRLLMLSAPSNIHFGCNAPSHWFLWRWNSDWTDLSWRPRAPSHMSPLHMKEDAPRCLTSKRRGANELVHLALHSLSLNITLLCKISSVSLLLNQSLQRQDEGSRNVFCNQGDASQMSAQWWWQRLINEKIPSDPEKWYHCFFALNPAAHVFKHLYLHDEPFFSSANVQCQRSNDCADSCDVAETKGVKAVMLDVCSVIDPHSRVHNTYLISDF